MGGGGSNQHIYLETDIKEQWGTERYSLNYVCEEFIFGIHDAHCT